MRGDRVLQATLTACAVLVGGLALGGGFVLVAGLFLAAPGPPLSGLLLATVGSLEIVLVALLVAVPLAVGAGVFVQEYGTVGLPVMALRALLRDLAQVPPVVHGVFGYAVFAGLLGLGPSALAAGLTLALVVLPGIVEATEAAVAQVPAHTREAALALGASRFQVVGRVVLPAAGQGIAGGALRAAARALGETAPLLLVGAVLADPAWNGAPIGSFGALTYRLWALADTGAREPFALALGLTLVVVVLSVAALRLRGGSAR